MEKDYGEDAIGKFAGEVGCSASLVRKQRQVSRVFENGTRVSLLSWRHHLLASQTDDPQGWIARASENQWSTRELAEAIKATKAEPDSHWRRLTRRGDRLHQELKTYLEEYKDAASSSRETVYLTALRKQIGALVDSPW